MDKKPSLSLTSLQAKIKVDKPTKVSVRMRIILGRGAIEFTWLPHLSSFLVQAIPIGNACDIDANQHSIFYPVHYMATDARLVAPKPIRELLDFILEKGWVWDGQVVRFFADEWWKRIPSEV